MIRLSLLVIFAALTLALAAQSGLSTALVSLPLISIPDHTTTHWDTLDLGAHTAIWVDSSGMVPNEEAPLQQYKPFAPIFVPKVFDTHLYTYWLRCPLENRSSSDTTRFYLSTGTQYLMEGYKAPDFLHPIARLGIGTKGEQRFMKPYNSLVLMTMAPKEVAMVYIKIKTFTGLTFSIHPLLIHSKANLSAYLPKRVGWHFIAYSYAVFLGIVAFLICFTMAQYALNKTEAYLHYILYLSGVCITNIRQLEVDLQVPILFSWQPILLLHGHMLFLVLIQISYVFFIVRFLHIQTNAPPLYRLLRYSLWGAILLLLAYVLAVLLGKYHWGTLVFVVTRALQMWVFMYSAYALWRSSDPIGRMVGIGLLWVCLGILFSLAVIVWPLAFPVWLAAFPIFFSLCGFVAEVILFSSALGLKSVLVEKAEESARVRAVNAENNLLAAQLSLFQERERIARDLHDDLGANLGAIVLLSNIALSKSTDASMSAQIEKIASSSYDASNKIHEIIWAANTHNDTLEKVLDYLHQYAAGLFAGSPIELLTQLPANIPPVLISGEHRRALFLVFKEVLNNTIKHAQPTRVEINFGLSATQIELCIRDNGRGFDLLAVGHSGNGLGNMRHRMASIGGQLSMDSNADGTTVSLKLLF